MSNVSEQITEMSAELLLKAVGELGQIAYNTANFVVDMGSSAGVIARTQMLRLIDTLKERGTSKEQQKALDKMQEAVLKEGEIPRQTTIAEKDRESVEKWLKKQNVLYVSIKNENQDVLPGLEKSVIAFLEKDLLKVQNALALTQYERGYVNELSPTALLLLNKNKNMAVVDNLDVYELEVFRRFAKDFGLVYAAMLTPDDSGDTYKIIASKKDNKKVAAVMQQVAWSMTGEYQEGIKEKIKERYSIKAEIQKLISEGIGPDKVYMTNRNGESFAIDNAKYIVNANSHKQYVKLTKDGFVHYKFGKEVDRASKGDADYEDKLQIALGEFSDAVVFDASEWEQEGLGKDNRRENKVLEKVSVFPLGFVKEKEARELQKARKKEHEQVPETAWLFDRYDTAKLYSEVYEANYNDYSEPPEKTVSVHFGEAVKHSEKYKYIDISNDEKSIDNIIRQAEERYKGNENFEIETELDM